MFETCLQSRQWKILIHFSTLMHPYASPPCPLHAPCTPLICLIHTPYGAPLTCLACSWLALISLIYIKSWFSPYHLLKKPMHSQNRGISWLEWASKKIAESKMAEFKMAIMSELSHLRLSLNLCELFQWFCLRLYVNPRLAFWLNSIWLNLRW